jgi:hypothetical protein
MSEYMRPVKAPMTFDQLDHSGTLFEATEPEEAQEKITPPVTTRVRRGREHNYPLTVEQRQVLLQQRLGQQALDAVLLDRPYQELGGHKPGAFDDQPSDPFESVIDGCEYWMRDVRLAIDRYGAPELTVEGIQAMTKADRRVLSLHFDGFMVRLKTAYRLIAAANGDVGAHSVLEHRYGPRSHDEMIAYLGVLENLNSALHANGVAQALHVAAYRVSSNKDMREKIRKADDESHGHVQVFFDGTKPRIERLPRHDNKPMPVPSS